MKILHSSSGDTSLLYSSCKRSLPSPEAVSECADFIAKEIILAKARIPRTPKIRRLDQRGIRDSVSKCEPPRFLFFRDLIPKIKKDCERYLPDKIPARAVRSACVRLQNTASPIEMLAVGICAKCCGVEELYLSISEEGFTNEHALAARLCDAKELLLCDELECVAEAAFGNEGQSRVDLLTGRGGEGFSIAAGLVSSFINVRTEREIKGRAMILAYPYDTECFSADVKRFLSQESKGQILLISANEDAVRTSLGDTDDGRLTLLVTSSDKESTAAAKKLDALTPSLYGERDPEFVCGDRFPPLMREVLSPCAEFSLDPRVFFTLARENEMPCALDGFASYIAKHVSRALSHEDADTVGVRLEKE